MAGRFVRASKYRHVFGQPSKKELCYDNLRLSTNAWDTNLIKVNPKYVAVNWDVSGGGAFAVIPLNETGKLPEQIPLFRGHTGPVLDTDWSPFDDQLIATASDDAKVGIYRVPDNFTVHHSPDDVRDVAPIEKLSGHTRKVGHVAFNPAANNVLASSSGDYTIRIWDLNTNSTKLSLKHSDMVTSLSWSGDGAMMVTTNRDRKLRYWDVRQERAVVEVPGHSGAKNSRVVWLGEHDRVATTGFSRMSDRQLALWDLRNSSEPLGGFTFLDSVGSICMPFWDDGTQMLYLAGKGDGNIRFYEYEKDSFVALSEYKSSEAQRGLAFMPKRGLNIRENEIMRAYKTNSQSLVEPISFTVPRRAEVFQGDIYPPTTGTRPAMDSDDFFAGKSAALPPKISLESVYEGQEPKEVAATEGRRHSPAPSITPTLSKSATVPLPSASSPSKTYGTLNDSKNSMASMAAKFADKDGDDDTDDTSSFEEIAKPVEKSSMSAVTKDERAEGRVLPDTSTRQASPTKTSIAPAPAPVSTPGVEATRESAASPVETSHAATRATSSEVNDKANAAEDHNAGARSVSGAKGAAEGIRGMLQEMKAMITQQGNELAAQATKIESLTKEVDALKSRA